MPVGGGEVEASAVDDKGSLVEGDDGADGERDASVDTDATDAECVAEVVAQGDASGVKVEMAESVTHGDGNEVLPGERDGASEEEGAAVTLELGDNTTLGVTNCVPTMDTLADPERGGDGEEESEGRADGRVAEVDGVTLLKRERDGKADALTTREALGLTLMERDGRVDAEKEPTLDTAAATEGEVSPEIVTGREIADATAVALMTLLRESVGMRVGESVAETDGDTSAEREGGSEAHADGDFDAGTLFLAKDVAE